MPSPSHVRIVMATLDGAQFVQDQIDSLLAQEHADWSLLVSDDGSRDATAGIVAEAARRHPGHGIVLRQGPGRSAAANFLDAIMTSPEEGAFLALSDQDDIWLPHRLGRAVAALAARPGPAIYASRTLLCDAHGRVRGLSRRHPRGPSFGNALVQNILPGNTIVLSPEAAALARATAPAALAARGGRGVAHHDWWFYALATGAGARVILDDRPGLLYRQHDRNVMGAHRGLRQAADRMTMLRDGRYGDWVAGNVEALGAVRDRLTPGAAALRDTVADWLAGRGPRFADLRRAGIRRQTLVGDALLAALVRQGSFGPQPEGGAGGSSAPPSGSPPGG
ncbi:glycosyltransferase [Wenxinia marina]|uniref:glycosyltransferase n=2 Tax=Wenxinia marina TaxID=390641 RepID=UPI0012E0BAFB|nr:glycosyltransferase [Wenxinia marina]